MTELDSFLRANRTWADRMVSLDAGYFDRLAEGQDPDILWIGCSDSRVPSSNITGSEPGEMFVHRNIANIVGRGDRSVSSVVQYAVDVLRVRHIIVCGHYGCGGVLAAIREDVSGPLAEWLTPIRETRDVHADELAALPDESSRHRRLCELNVVAQVQAAASMGSVADAWDRGQPLAVHAWIFDVGTGLVSNLSASVGLETLS